MTLDQWHDIEKFYNSITKTYDMSVDECLKTVGLISMNAIIVDGKQSPLNEQEKEFITNLYDAYRRRRK